jgi:hypothetical protein
MWVRSAQLVIRLRNSYIRFSCTKTLSVNRCFILYHWVSKHPSFGFLKYRKHNFSETGSLDQWFKLSLSKGPNTIGISPPLTWGEKHPVSETLFSVQGVSKRVPNVAVWRVLRKRLQLKAYMLSIVLGVERWIVCTPLSVNILRNTRNTVTFGITL